MVIFTINLFLIKLFSISQASESDFLAIKQLIQLFELDNRDLHYKQFLVAKHEGELLGFGRIRKHNGCDEFCSLGVLESKRFNGIAKELILARIKIAKQPIYLVCIIPEYFESLGFVIVDEYPPEIADKWHYCTAELFVPETYVVMKYQNQTT